MAAPKNHWKLGLFVVVGLVLSLATVGVLGARSQQKEVGAYVTYFDESVQGLDVGSAIKFRGVTIGVVGGISVAQDHRLVEVTMDIGVEELSRLGLDVPSTPLAEGEEKRLHQEKDLRVQLASSGLTGLKFLQLDFFLVADTPAPLLAFQAPENYIPAAPSMMKNLEDALTRTMNQLPGLVERADRILASVDGVVGDLRDKRVGDHLVVTLASADRALAKSATAIASLEKVSLRADHLLQGLDETVTLTNGMLQDVGGERGLLASVGRATDAVGDTARNADELGTELGDALRSVRDAARSVRRLSDALEKDPDMLLKGRSTAVEP